MRRIRIVVAYDGTNYCGWQIQPNGITIEEILNRQISKLTGEDIRIIGASRTDSGVHALGNVAVFDTESRIPGDRFAYALNQKMPEDIVIVRSDEVSLDWHPRYQNEISKTYEYHIYNAKVRNPLKSRYSTFVSFDLDVEKMREGAQYILGEHDFASFCNVRTNAKDTVRTVHEISITEIPMNMPQVMNVGSEDGVSTKHLIRENLNSESGKEIVIRVTGNGFLYNMVRIIAGTLIRVGRGFYEPEKIRAILEAKEHTSEGITAPPNGLVLVSIDYPE